MIRPHRCPAVLLSSSVLVFALAAGQNPDIPPLAIVHGPSLTNPATDEMTVLWSTNRPCVSWVEYASGGNFRTFPQFGGLIRAARASRHGLFDAYRTRHAVRLSGLEPGKAYRYRVVSKEILQFEPYEVVFGTTVSSEISEFRTLNPAKAEFSFVVFQDIHGQASRLAELAAWADLPGADLVFFNGDTLEAITTEDYFYQGFLDPATRLFARGLPFVYVRGNHDTRGVYARLLEDFIPPRAGRYYYSFDHGRVRFIVLDTGEDKPDDSPVYAGLVDFDRYRLEEAGWLKAEVKTPSFREAAFRVALIHMPPFGPTGYAVEHLTRQWGPLLNEGGVDVVLSGHYHKAYRYDPSPGKNAFPVLGGPQDGLIKAHVGPGHINFQIIDIKGNQIDSLRLPAKPK